MKISLFYWLWQAAGHDLFDAPPQIYMTMESEDLEVERDYYSSLLGVPGLSLYIWAREHYNRAVNCYPNGYLYIADHAHGGLELRIFGRDIDVFRVVLWG